MTAFQQMAARAIAFDLFNLISLVFVYISASLYWFEKYYQARKKEDQPND